MSDLSPLAGLSGPTSLHLRDPKVSDLSPLAGLSGLTSLDLRDTQVRDLSPLAGLGKLKTIYLAKDQELRIRIPWKRSSDGFEYRRMTTDLLPLTDIGSRPNGVKRETGQR